MFTAAGTPVPVTIIGVAPHRGEIRDLVLGLKFGRKRTNARVLADVVLSALPTEILAASILTWAPTTIRHRHERGMDHAEEIARWVAATTRAPVRKLLRRVNDKSQAGLGREERQHGPAFVARPLSTSRSVIVVDDVVTTGATFRAAASALVRVGAIRVICVAPSRTV